MRTMHLLSAALLPLIHVDCVGRPYVKSRAVSGRYGADGSVILDGKAREYRAEIVTVAAGTYLSPDILQLSGISSRSCRELRMMHVRWLTGSAGYSALTAN